MPLTDVTFNSGTGALLFIIQSLHPTDLGIVEYLVDPAVEVEHGGVGRRGGGEAVDVGEGERREGAL